MDAQVGGRDVIISQTGFTGEKGYEIYLRDATKYAEDMWNAVLAAGIPYNLRVVAPSHHRRIAAGILSWGQDMDFETLPFQVNLGYQVPRKKEADYIGKERLEEVRAQLEAGNPPYKTQLVGLVLGGNPITDYAPDFWLVSDTPEGEAVGYVTSRGTPRSSSRTSRWPMCPSHRLSSAPSSGCTCPNRTRTPRVSRCAPRWSRCRSARASTPTSVNASR